MFKRPRDWFAKSQPLLPSSLPATMRPRTDHDSIGPEGCFGRSLVSLHYEYGAGIGSVLQMRAGHPNRGGPLRERLACSDWLDRGDEVARDPADDIRVGVALDCPPDEAVRFDG